MGHYNSSFRFFVFATEPSWDEPYRYTLMKLALILSAVPLSLASIVPTRFIAQESNYVCFMEKPDGTMTDLSKMCQPPSPKLTGDAAFLADFESMANQYPYNVKQALDKYIKQNRDSAIASAKTTCRVLKSGGMAAQSERRERLAADNPSPSEQARLQIIEPLAISYYCPEFASR